MSLWSNTRDLTRILGKTKFGLFNECKLNNKTKTSMAYSISQAVAACRQAEQQPTERYRYTFTQRSSINSLIRALSNVLVQTCFPKLEDLAVEFGFTMYGDKSAIVDYSDIESGSFIVETHVPAGRLLFLAALNEEPTITKL